MMVMLFPFGETLVLQRGRARAGAECTFLGLM